MTVKSLKEFVEIITPLSPDSAAKVSGHYWYRGQTNEEWGLETSFLRTTRHLAKQRKEAIRLEDVARQEFRSKAHLFIDPGNMAHGAPTRLLDWTASPYVAAYFATQQDGSDRDGAVWCFCHRRLQKAFVKVAFVTPA